MGTKVLVSGPFLFARRTTIRLPKPGNKEEQDNFHKRCMELVMGEKKDMDPDQANAMCHQQWRNRGEFVHPADTMILEASDADWLKADKTRLPASCFLWVEHPNKKGTWRARVYMGAGGIDTKTGMYKERGDVNLNALRVATFCCLGPTHA